MVNTNNPGSNPGEDADIAGLGERVDVSHLEDSLVDRPLDRNGGG